MNNMSPIQSKVEEKKAEIIGWMNHSIPRGKTIPNFEELVDELIIETAQESRREERDRMRKEISEALWNEDGSLKSHDLSHVVSTAIHKTITSD